MDNEISIFKYRNAITHTYIIYVYLEEKKKKKSSVVLCRAAEFIAIDTNNTVEVKWQATTVEVEACDLALFSFTLFKDNLSSHVTRLLCFLAFLLFLTQKTRSNIPMKLWVITALNCNEY